MKKQKLMTKSQYKTSSSLAVLILASGILLSSAQPARAEVTVEYGAITMGATVAEWAKDIAYYAAEATNWYQAHIASVIQTEVTAITGWMQANLLVKITNTTSLNNHTNTVSGVVATEALSMALPPGYSSCRHAQATNNRDEAGSTVTAVSGAIAQANNNRPDSAAANAQDIQAEMNDGLAICKTSTSSDASNYQAMKCKVLWGGEFEGADLNMGALFGAYAGSTGSKGIYDLPIPPKFSNFTNGTYQPIPLVTSPIYMPFVAAYSFCQRINPRRLPLPPANASNPSAAVLLAGLKNDADAAMSMAYTMCIDDLAERIQVGQGADSSFTTPLPGMPAKSDMRDQQITGCTASAGEFWLDPDYVTDCQANGRSFLQAEHDDAYRAKFTVYQQHYLTGQTAQFVMQENDTTGASQNAFDNMIRIEKSTLSSAIADAHAAEHIYVNAVMAQPIKP